MKQIQESTLNLENFRKGLFTLRDSLATINERESAQDVEELKEGFLCLFSAINNAKEKGLWRKTHLNLFEVFGINRLESVHSNILAWLLNPEEAHGFGEKFLRDFINKVFIDNKLPSKLFVKVTTEKKDGENILDIVVEGKNWWLVIENKVDSGEQENQTIRYAEKYKQKGKLGEKVFLVLLSPEGVPPVSSYFTPVSYRIIRELLETLLKTLHFESDSDILIRHFIDHIILDFGE